MTVPARAADASKPDAVLRFETAVIPHTNHVEAIEAIRSLHGRYRPPDSEVRFKARALMLLGATGSGKTTALEAYLAEFPTLTLEAAESCEAGSVSSDILERLRDGDIRKVVYVEVPERTTRRALVAAILAAFGYKTRAEWNTSEVIEKIAFFAEQLNTEMIFLDECHHFINEKNPDATIEITEFLKSLLNRVKVQIVLAGLPILLEIAGDDPRTAQLRRRLQPPILLSPYDWRTQSGRLRFLSVLRAMEMLMELPEPSGLAVHEFAKRLYVASGGEIGILSKYLSEALRIALRDGRRSLTPELLADVHQSWEPQHLQKEEILNFDAPIDDRSTPPSLSLSAAGAHNPFLCDGGRLVELWAERGKQGQASTAANKLTLLHAAGRGQFSPFGKGD